MMRLLLPIILLLFGILGGVGAGWMIGGGSTEEVVEDDGAGGEGHADEEHAEEGHGDEEHGEETSANPPRVEAASDTTEYVRINNQFIVPIVRDGSVRSLVVMGLTVEVDTGTSGDVFTHEPRLRDSFLRVLFAHANAGGFDGSFTQAAAMEPLREGLVEAAAQVLGSAGVYDVLITDITRQDA